MNTRRDLLRAIGAATALPFLRRFEAEWSGSGLLVPAPPRAQILLANPEGLGFFLSDGDPWDIELPSVTNREHLIASYGDVRDGLEDHFGEDLPDDVEAYLDEQVDDEVLVDGYIDRNSTPAGNAYHLLAPLDLGPELLERDTGHPHVRFVDGACPGNDWLGVQVSDLRSLALLQRRLDDLRTGIVLEVG